MVDAQKFVRIVSFVPFVFFSAVAFAQTPPPAPHPNDIVVVLDVSGSMKESGVIADVKSYVDREIVKNTARVGDRFTLIEFGAKARVVFQKDVASESDLDEISRRIAAVKAEDGFTDLGVALETFDGALASHSDGAYRPVAIFITDGKNAPPPSSPYSGKDLAVDDKFKATGKKIAMKGWKLYVVGLGDNTDAPAVAAAVGGSTLAPSSDALKETPLGAYLTETEQDTAKRAAETAAAVGGSPPKGTFSVMGVSPYAFFVVAAVLLAAVALVIFIHRRTTNDDDKKKPV
jgi:hypothetical protein